MIFIADGSTGGTTLMAYLLNYTKGYSISKAYSIWIASLYLPPYLLWELITHYTRLFLFICASRSSI